MMELIKSLGFEIADTGGNCKAYQYTYANENYIWITNDDGIDIPTDKNEGISVGYYDPKGEVLGACYFNNFADFEQNIQMVMDDTEKYFVIY